MTLEAGTRLRLARKARLRWDARNEKMMLLYPERGLLLNAVGARIVELCDGTRTWDEVVGALSSAFPDVDPSALRRDAIAFVEKLAARGLWEKVA